MPNDHYVPQFLTKRWRGDDGRLLVFDVQERAFERVPASRLFANEGLNSTELESRFNRVIETPAATYIHRALRGDPHARLELPAEDRDRTALVALCLLQPARVADGEQRGRELHELLTSDAIIHDFARAFEERCQLFVVQTVPNEPMFFTAASVFIAPVIGAAPAVIQPVTPWHGIGLGAPRNGHLFINCAERRRAPRLLSTEEGCRDACRSGTQALSVTRSPVARFPRE